MLLEKLYAETLDIPDPDNYCADPDRHVMTFLRRRFEGRCRKGAFVVRVLGVARRSRCRMRDTDLSAEGYVDVEFWALVSVLAQWDILTGVEVAARAQLIVGRSEAEGATTIATLLPTPEAETVREKQTVAIRVLRIQYNADQPQATAVGPLLTCDRAAPVYLLEAPLTAADAAALAPLARRVRDLLAERRALAAARPRDVAFFDALLYTYARAPNVSSASKTPGGEWEGPAAHPLPPGAEAASLLAVVEGAARADADVAGLWSRDLAIHRSAPLAARAAPGAAPPRWGPPTAATPRTAFALMLKTVHEFLKTTNELVAQFDSLEKLESHKNIWLVMRGAQLPAPA